MGGGNDDELAVEGKQLFALFTIVCESGPSPRTTEEREPVGLGLISLQQKDLQRFKRTIRLFRLRNLCRLRKFCGLSWSLPVAIPISGCTGKRAACALSVGEVAKGQG